jgi:hypothetical protein
MATSKKKLIATLRESQMLIAQELRVRFYDALPT